MAPPPRSLRVNIRLFTHFDSLSDCLSRNDQAILCLFFLSRIKNPALANQAWSILLWQSRITISVWSILLMQIRQNFHPNQSCLGKSSDQANKGNLWAVHLQPPRPIEKRFHLDPLGVSRTKRDKFVIFWNRYLAQSWVVLAEVWISFP